MNCSILGTILSVAIGLSLNSFDATAANSTPVKREATPHVVNNYETDVALHSMVMARINKLNSEGKCPDELMPDWVRASLKACK